MLLVDAKALRWVTPIACTSLWMVAGGCHSDRRPSQVHSKPAPKKIEERTPASRPAPRATNVTPAQVPRVSVAEARRASLAGKARLVCAYGSDGACNKMRFERALTLQELEAQATELAKDASIFFYCS